MENKKEKMKEILSKGSEMVLMYGSSAQKKVTAKADKLMENLHSEEHERSIQLIVHIMEEIKEFDVDKVLNKGKIKRKILFIRKKRHPLQQLLHYFEETYPDIENKMKELERMQFRMVRDIIIFKKEENEIKEIETELNLLIETAKEVQDQQEKESETYILIEKRIQGLLFSLYLLVQMEKQIEIMKQNMESTVKMIQESLTNTIPLWKNNLMNFLTEVKFQHSYQPVTEEDVQKINHIKQKQEIILNDLEHMKNIQIMLKETKKEIKRKNEL